MRLTILGKSPAWSDAGGAGSGYLIEHGDDAVVLDFGTGVFAVLRGVRDYASIRDIVLSHFDADHVADLAPLVVGLMFSPRGPLEPVTVHAAPGSAAKLEQLMTLYGFGAFWERALDVREYDPAGLRIGALQLRFAEVEHHVPAFAVSVAEPGGSRLVFSADTGPADALVDLARGADLLLCEATLARPAAHHLTARQAGEHAAAAGVGRLVLTHYSDELDPRAILDEARAAYSGPVELAAPGAVHGV